ncbi:hypothetical protein AGDE_02705 [Angomonas deanei]|nr:hypothetical protein AGDE_02705 [Angomonas deanei]|eukprot:EPY41220.1 hypothetical protein AGDE_02705 [Angomonas deanei]
MGSSMRTCSSQVLTAASTRKVSSCLNCSFRYSNKRSAASCASCASERILSSDTFPACSSLGFLVWGAVQHGEQRLHLRLAGTLPQTSHLPKVVFPEFLVANLGGDDKIALVSEHFILHQTLVNVSIVVKFVEQVAQTVRVQPDRKHHGVLVGGPATLGAVEEGAVVLHNVARH